MSFSKYIALRYLGTKRSEAFITLISLFSILGVAVGVMVLCVVMAIMTGFQQELREKVLGTNAHVNVRSLTGSMTHWHKIQTKLEALANVQSVSPYTYHQVLLRNNDSSQGMLLRGLEANSAAAKQIAQYLEKPETIEKLFKPQFLENEISQEQVELPGLIVGKELARSAGLIVGSPVSLLAPSVGSTPFGLMPRYRRFVVVGIYTTGLSEYESGLAYTSIPAAQQFFRMDDAINGFEIRVHDIEESGAVAKQVIHGFSGLYATDWAEQNRPLWDALRLEKTVYFIVLLLIIVMASISIITTLIMLVLEKRRDIAVFMTLGASPQQVGRIFRTQGAIIGLVGTMLGLFLGVSVSLGLKAYGFPLDEKVFPFSTLPIRLEPLNFMLVGFCAFLICFLATIYPARRASRLDPSEILRHD